MATDKRRLVVGAALLALGSVLIFGMSFIGSPLPAGTAAIAAVVIAAGTLLIGLSGEETGV